MGDSDPEPDKQDPETGEPMRPTFNFWKYELYLDDLKSIAGLVRLSHFALLLIMMIAAVAGGSPGAPFKFQIFLWLVGTAANAFFLVNDFSTSGAPDQLGCKFIQRFFEKTVKSLPFFLSYRKIQHSNSPLSECSHISSSFSSPSSPPSLPGETTEASGLSKQLAQSVLSLVSLLASLHSLLINLIANICRLKLSEKLKVCFINIFFIYLSFSPEKF